jgi:hypothetical protein
MLTSPLDSTLLPRYSTHLLSQDSRTLCRCYSVLLHEDGTEPMPPEHSNGLVIPSLSGKQRLQPSIKTAESWRSFQAL